MIRINLLPHREQKRKARLTRFVVLAAVAALAGAVVIGLSYVWLSTLISTQDSRNQFLSDENAKLDKQIAEIETLKKERQQLLDRKKVVERLQANRSESVKILDQLTRQTPEGVFLSEITQKDDTLTISGYAQSNARVATFMRSLADSTIFTHESPNLIQSSAATVAGQPVSRFNLTVKILREQVDTGKADKAKGAGK
jgi:type IV pilus assembly protein PilN